MCYVCVSLRASLRARRDGGDSAKAWKEREEEGDGREKAVIDTIQMNGE